MYTFVAYVIYDKYTIVYLAYTDLYMYMDIYLYLLLHICDITYRLIDCVLLLITIITYL